jgi:uncharacterized protein (TIGR02001 family)
MRGLHTIFFKISIFVLLISFANLQSAGAAEKSSSESATSAGPHIYSNITLTTDSIEEGLTTTADSLAVQPELGYRGNTWKAGVWGSNVAYPDNAESLDLRPLTAVDIRMGAATVLSMQAQADFYSKGNSRNGYSGRLDLAISGHHAILQYDTNFYGTSTSDLWLAYAKNWKMFWDLEYALELGYMNVNSSLYNSYFGVKTGIVYPLKDFKTSLLASFNSGASQFNQTTTPVYLVISASF